LLPEGWTEVRLGDVAERRSGFWGDDSSSAGRDRSALILTISDFTYDNRLVGGRRRYLSASEYERSRITTEDVAIAGSGNSLGKLYRPLVGVPDLCASNFVKVLRPGDSLLTSYLFFWLSSSGATGQMRSHTGGTGIPNLHASFFNDAEIPLPPLEEQHRIVAVLEQADRAVEAATRHVTDAEALMLATVLNEIYLPKAHSTMVLGEALQREVRTVSLIGGREYPVVGVAKEGMGLVYREPLTTKNTKYRTLLRAEPWDVVVRTITAFESPVAVMGAEETGYHVSGVFLTYRVLDNADPRYLRHVFSCPPFWEEMKSRARGSVLRRKTISHSDFCAIPVPMPSLAEQQAIVARIEKVETAVRAAEAHLAHLRALRSSLLENLVSGRVRLPDAETAGSEVTA
jgi:restriction endonuclease S subunit